MDQTIKDIETYDGIRLTWNIWPAAPLQNDVVPTACLYNPHQECPILEYEPTPCSKCQSILCPFSIVDSGSRTWTCNFCGARNNFNREITEENIEECFPELIEGNNTVEYILNRVAPFPPIFLFVIDTCTYDAERHSLMISGLKQTFELLPEDCLVGIILYGTNIDFISFTDDLLKTVYQFSGEHIYKKEDIKGLEDVRNFLVKKSDKYSEIMDIFNNLKQDPFPILNGHRPIRCTGAALSFATCFISGPFADSPVKILLFTQGGCTSGPGKVIPVEIAADEKLDLIKSGKFYEELGITLNSIGASVDIIAETIADVGLSQLEKITIPCGGAIIMAQDFEEIIKTKSIDVLYKSINNVMTMGFNSKIAVKTSPNVSFKGFIGEGLPCGSGWKVGSLIPSTNITLLLDSNDKSKPNNFGFVQIISQYQRSDRKIITRATTFSRMFSGERSQLIQSFDQEAAVVLQARLFCKKAYENVFDLESAIDKHLIKFTKRFGSFQRNDPQSVKLPDSMSYYINFMFFFRRSFVIQKDGISADESSYFKNLLYKLRTPDALKLIKPSLISFHYQGSVQPVELNAESLDSESMLVLDSFHNILLWNGMDVSNWISQNIHKQSEYSFFSESIKGAKDYVSSLIEGRMPAPQFRETAAGKSQERILLTHVNPSGALNTQKIDFAKFYDTLCRFIARGE